MDNKKLQLEVQPIDHGRIHSKPKSRRDFLAQGLINGVGAVMAPSLLSLISQRAMGAECTQAEAGGSQSVPFIALDLSGGANIGGMNVIVGKKGGQRDFLASYESLGMTNALSPKTNASNMVALNGNIENSLLFHAQSPFYRGFLAATEATTRANMDGVLFCTASIDDTGANPHNPLYWINKAGLEGQLVSLVGTTNSRSGGRGDAPEASVNPLKAPVRIVNPDSTLGLVDLGLLGTLLNPAKAEKIMKAVSKMSEAQLASFNQKQLPDKLKELVSCGYINSAGLISQFGPDQLDPRKDNEILAAYKNDLATGANARACAVTKLVLDGYAGAGVVEMGGYDYHTGTFLSETQDEAAGKQAGQMFQAAAEKGVPLVLYIFTDGGVASSASGEQNGKFPWRGESGQRSSAVMLVYSPKGKPKIRNGKRQVGAFNDNGAVNTSATVISSSVANLTKLVVANYLALFGKEGDLAKIVGDNPFGADLDKMLSFSADTLGA